VDAAQATKSTIARRLPVIGCLTSAPNGKLMGSPRMARTAKRKALRLRDIAKPVHRLRQDRLDARAGMNGLDQHRVLPPAATQQVGYGVLLAAVL
jgi:hypothetical protein